MVKNIGLVWLKDDFRIKKNSALIEATKNHTQVVAFYLYKQEKFESQEAQGWWISQSLKEFRTKLYENNINLEIIKTKTYKSFFEKLFNKKNFSIYWNKTYEPNYLKFDQYLSKKFEINGINYKIFKGNILNEFSEIKKNDGTPFKVFFGKCENFIWIKFQKRKKISKCVKRASYFENTIDVTKIFPKINGIKNLKIIDTK